MVEVVGRVDEQLRKEMVEAQSQVARWITEQKQVADMVTLQKQRLLENDKENMEQLQEDLKAIGSAGEALQQQSVAEREQNEALRRELEQLTVQEGALPPEQQRLANQLEQQRELAQQQEHGCEHLLASKDMKLGELRQGCALYSARLGLTFERVGDERLRLIFTNIDPQAPARQFCFQVFVDANDKYHVEACDPPVSAMSQLLQALNSGNDFSAFVRGMRKQFRQLV